MTKQQKKLNSMHKKLALEAFENAFPERLKQWTAKQNASNKVKELLDKLVTLKPLEKFSDRGTLELGCWFLNRRKDDSETKAREMPTVFLA